MIGANLKSQKQNQKAWFPFFVLRPIWLNNGFLFFFRQFWTVRNFSRSYSEAEKLDGLDKTVWIVSKAKVFRNKTNKKKRYFIIIYSRCPLLGEWKPLTSLSFPLEPLRHVTEIPHPLNEHEQMWLKWNKIFNRSARTYMCGSSPNES